MSDDETIHDVLKRVVAAQPKIFLQGHEGYYRHADISALIRESRTNRLTIPHPVVWWCEKEER